jgi:two-component system sensor histidine kinase VicK
VPPQPPEILRATRQLPLYLIGAILFSFAFSSCERKETETSFGIDTTQSYSQLDTLERAINEILMSIPQGSKVEVIDSFFENKKHIPFTRERHLAYRAAHYLRDERFLKAMADLDTLINITERNPYAQKIYAEALFNKADIYILLGKYSYAYEHYNKAGEVAIKTKNACISSMFNYRIAMVFYKQEFYSNAITYFVRAKRDYLACDSTFIPRFRVQEIYDNIGLCYFKQKKYDSAQIYYDSTLAYIDNMPNPTELTNDMLNSARAVVYVNQAHSLLHLGDTAKALSKFELGISPVSKMREKIFTAGALLRMSEVYAALKQLDKAEAAISEAEELQQQTGVASIKHDLYKARWKISLLNNDKDQALKYAKVYWELKDSLIKEEKEMQANSINLFMQAFEFNERESELVEEGKNREQRLLLSVIIAIVAFIATMISLFSWMKSRKQNRQLLLLNEQIADQSKTIKQTYEDLKLLDQTKDRIMGIVAHDLRNPISAIYSMATLLNEQAKERKDEEEIQMTNLVRTACEGSLELIQEIMMVADLQHNKGFVKKERVRINEFVDSTVKLIRFKSAEKRQTIQMILPEKEQEIMMGPDKMRRVLSNLLVNAIKFSKDGSNILVKSEIQNGHWIVSVKDQGIGIPDLMKSQIFETFTKAKRAGTSGEKPFGLGLSIVKQIVEAHGGKIWFESEEGLGSTFFVQLPVE